MSKEENGFTLRGHSNPSKLIKMLTNLTNFVKWESVKNEMMMVQ